MRRKLILLAFFGLLLAGSAVAYFGYGSPLREVVFARQYPSDVTKAFYVTDCSAVGRCDIDPAHRKVLHFWQGDGVQGHPGNIEGDGANPVFVLREAGVTILPKPDYLAAALKWCTGSHIRQEIASHGRRFVVPLTGDELATAKCVKRSLPGRFSVTIADPLGRDEDASLFTVLERD